MFNGEFENEILGAVMTAVIGTVTYMLQRHHKRIDRMERKVDGIPEKYVTKEDARDNNNSVVAELQSIRSLLSDVLLKMIK
jgi:uncharacterized UPF0160 family protein